VIGRPAGERPLPALSRPDGAPQNGCSAAGDRRPPVPGRPAPCATRGHPWAVLMVAGQGRGSVGRGGSSWPPPADAPWIPSSCDSPPVG
jgi:hypothetical protein